jgi:cellulose synthase/poly-beta-1,6-N-acetylglucosamine synthase-like glycosyltransferase
MLIVFFIVSFLFFIVYTILICYYRKGWLSLLEIKNTDSGVLYLTSVSIIIPARNEEKNIADCLRSVLSQNYPTHLFEVIVVDDHSEDRTAEIVNSFNSPNLKLVSLKEVTDNEQLNSYKKKAIEIAIQQSTGELIVTTDADCIVLKTWIQSIAGYYEQYKPAFIAGLVTYFNENSFLKIFESLDFITMQGITGASVYKRFHTMCNGANLAYEKKVFYEVGGFKGIDNIASGDDMLLMHKIYERYPERVVYLKSKDAIVQTLPMGTFSSFFNQRIRWASKADKYDDKRIFLVLLLVYFFNLWFIVLFLFGIYNLKYLILLFVLLVAKTIIELLLLFPVAKFFSKQKLLWWFPVAQPFHILYIIIAGWLGKFGTYKWKERKVQ